VYKKGKAMRIQKSVKIVGYFCVGAVALWMQVGGLLAQDSAGAGDEYICRLATEPVVLDGVLDDPVWQSAMRVDRFKLFRPAQGQYMQSTVGRLAWDDHYLYLAFVCEDQDVQSASTQHDDYLAAGDVVELYIKYGQGESQYYELVSAPNGTTFDARWPYRGSGDFKQFTPWESGLESATVVSGTPDDAGCDDRGFVVEVRVPWAAFDGVVTPPREGDLWTFGLFRYDHNDCFDEPHLLMSFAEHPKHGFHSYELYSPLRFTREGRVAP